MNEKYQPYRGGQGHADEDLEDMGAALLWPSVVAVFLIALLVSAALLGGCAPTSCPAPAPTKWCEDCAGGGR